MFDHRRQVEHWRLIGHKRRACNAAIVKCRLVYGEYTEIDDAWSQYGCLTIDRLVIIRVDMRSHCGNSITIRAHMNWLRHGGTRDKHMGVGK